MNCPKLLNIHRLGGRVDSAFASQSVDRGFELRPRQTKGVQNGAGCFLAKRSALRGYNQDWVARCQDNVTGWCIRVLWLRKGASVLAALKTRALSRLMHQAVNRRDMTERLLKAT